MSTLLVMGNAAVDLTLRMNRLPVAGETVLADCRREDVGGKGLNQAVAAHRTGARVRLVAAVGEDLGAALIRRSLAVEGIDPADLVSVDAATDRSVVMLSQDGENMLVTSGAAAQAIGPDAVPQACAGLGRGDLLLLQGNLRSDTTEAAVKQARRRGMQVLANPAPLSFDWSALVPMLDLLVLNEVEATQVDVEGAPNVVVTRGSKGADMRVGEDSLRIAAPPVDAVDSTGAGDVLTGVLAGGLSKGMALETALRWGIAAASTKVRRFGTVSAFPGTAELANLRP